MSPLVLAIDQGTTGTTCLVVDDELRTRGRGYRDVPQHFPRAGWVEHDPEELWESVLGAAKDALRDAGSEARDLAAVGIANQRETIVVFDRETGRVLDLEGDPLPVGRIEQRLPRRHMPDRKERAAGEQAVVADAMEACGQHVHQETADELIRRERHDLVALGALDPVVLPFESDAFLIAGDQAAVGVVVVGPRLRRPVVLAPA